MDTLARRLASPVGQLLSLQVVVENRTGGTGLVCLAELVDEGACYAEVVRAANITLN